MRVLQLYQSSVGKKVVMAVSGLFLVGFLLGHMTGNLKVFLGRDDSACRIECRSFLPYLFAGNTPVFRLLAGRTFGHLGSHPAGQNSIRSDAMRSTVLGDRTHQAKQSSLGAIVGTSSLFGDQTGG